MKCLLGNKITTASRISAENGAISIIGAVFIIVIVGLIGLTVDAGHYLVQKSRLQALADASALTCAQLDCEKSEASLKVLQRSYDMEDIELRVRPARCPAAIDGTCVSIDIKKSWTPSFTKFFGKGEQSASVSATALRGSSPKPEPRPATMPAIMATGNNASPWPLEFHRDVANSEIKVAGDVVSNATSGVRSVVWLGDQTVHGDVYACGPIDKVVPAANYQLHPSLSEPTVDPCLKASLPPANFCMGASCKTMPRCDQWAGLLGKSSVTIEPGSYDSLNDFAPRSTLGGWWILGALTYSCTYNFKPGIYYVKNTLNLQPANSKVVINANDVVFVVDTNYIEFAGNYNVRVSAPKSGAYKGIVLHKPSGNLQMLTIASGRLNWDGLIYVPNGNLHLMTQGGGQVTTRSLVGKHVRLENSGVNSVIGVTASDNAGVCRVDDTPDPGNTGFSGAARLVS